MIISISKLVTQITYATFRKFGKFGNIMVSTEKTFMFDTKWN